MRKPFFPIVFVAIVLSLPVAGTAAAQVQFAGNATAPSEPLALWYRRPAVPTQWTQALAIGNGRIGAMVFGGVNQERLQMNEDTLWAGGPYDPVNPRAKTNLPQARQLIFDGKYQDAKNLINSTILAVPSSEMSYEPAGDLILNFPEVVSVENYRRDLNLDTAVAGVSYTANGVHFSRSVFASPVDQVIVVRLTANKNGSISFNASCARRPRRGPP